MASFGLPVYGGSYDLPSSTQQSIPWWQVALDNALKGAQVYTNYSLQSKALERGVIQQQVIDPKTGRVIGNAMVGTTTGIPGAPAQGVVGLGLGSNLDIGGLFSSLISIGLLVAVIALGFKAVSFVLKK